MTAGRCGGAPIFGGVNLIKEIIQTGASVDAAIQSGCLLLGVAREDAEFEIIDLPRKTLFGLKTLPAKVRVYVEVPDPKPAPAPVSKQPEAQPRPVRTAAEPQQQPAAQQPAAAALQPAPDAREGRPPRRDRGRGKGGEGRPASEAQPQSRPLEEEPAITPDEATLTKSQAVADYIKSVLTAMGAADAVVTPRYTQSGVRFTLSGPDLGVVIGRRGETLDSLQYLAGLVANRMEGDYLRITIDSGNYREKRERTLEALARKLALQAVRTGKSQTLEPMNPYERRIIHAAVSQIRGATSASTGEEPNRRVVIKSTVPPRGDRSERGGEHSDRGDRGDRGGDRRGRGGRGGRGGHGGRGDRAPRPQQAPQPQAQTGADEAARNSTVAPTAEKAPKRLEDQDVHLYGKIEL